MGAEGAKGIARGGIAHGVIRAQHDVAVGLRHLDGGVLAHERHCAVAAGRRWRRCGGDRLLYLFFFSYDDTFILRLGYISCTNLHLFLYSDKHFTKKIPAENSTR